MQPITCLSQLIMYITTLTSHQFDAIKIANYCYDENLCNSSIKAEKNDGLLYCSFSQQASVISPP